MRETFECLRCGSNLRQRHLARVIMELFGGGRAYRSFAEFLPRLSGRQVYLTQSYGPLHRSLRGLGTYRCSEFFPDRAPGSSRDGVRCEDLHDLSFEEDSFDLVVSQDVFEHVREPDRAWGEIRRVLKPGGAHVFSVPCERGPRTVTRVRVAEGREIPLEPPVHHGDRIRDGLVYTDFGWDLPEHLADLGLPTETRWLEEEGIPRDASYIFVSRKPARDGAG